MNELVRAAASAFVPVAGPLAAAGATAPSGTAEAPTARQLRILHVLRAPVGGLFRHVLDLASGQIERGHSVGLIVDSMTGGPRADAALGALTPRLALGLTRLPIARQLSFRDFGALRVVARRLAALAPDVLHGHGAKGAALARLTPRAGGAIRVYTPHGGTLVYEPGTLAGGFYRGLERLLNRHTDLFLFESDYAARAFTAQIGMPRGLIRVVRNGVGAADFAAVAPTHDAADLICIGEQRILKGIDVLIAALAVLKSQGRTLRAVIAGDGPDAAQFKQQAAGLGVAQQVRFIGHHPARDAFAMGRMLIVPSRAESLPYIVLEAAAAGMPVIATRVGGIPEIFGPQACHLIAPGDAAALAGAIAAALDDPAQSREIARAVTARVRADYTVSRMVDDGLAAYRAAIANRPRPRSRAMAA